MFEGCIGMVYAPKGAGKSYFSLWLAGAIAGGGDFLRWKAPKQSKVLYLDTELCQSLLKSRSLQLAKSQAFDTPEDGITFITPDLFKSGETPPINTPDGQAFYNCLMQTHNILIIDNYCTGIVPGKKETEEDTWRNVENWLKKLRGAGKAVLLVHHAGKSGQQLGTSRKEHIMNWMIELKNVRGIDGEDGIKLWLKFEKHNRNFDKESPTLFIRFYSIGEDEIQWEWCDAKERQKRLVRYYNAKGASASDIAELVHLSHLEVKLLLKETENDTQDDPRFN